MSTPRRAAGKPAASSQLLSDLAYEAIRDKLVHLDIAPGDAIDEVQLATELGLGRTPVREAIKRLAYQRLVVVYPRSGSYAAQVDVADLASLCDIRERLEGLAAERAASEARYEERQELRQLLDELEGDCPPSRLLELDTAAHRAVHRLSHNEYLFDILTQTLDLSLRIWNLARERLPHLEHHVHGQVGILRPSSTRPGEGPRTRRTACARVRGRGQGDVLRRSQRQAQPECVVHSGVNVAAGHGISDAEQLVAAIRVAPHLLWAQIQQRLLIHLAEVG